ncbi:MAG: oxidoreductase, partial [Rhizobiaceae bacterium]
ARMSDSAGIICDGETVGNALNEARKLNEEIRDHGITYGRPAEAARAIQRAHMALASEAVLTALDYFIQNGGGSRGARAICDPDGESLPETRNGPLEEYRFRKEQEAQKAEQIVVRMDNGATHISVRGVRKFDEDAKSFFERDWPDWLTGQIYKSDS